MRMAEQRLHKLLARAGLTSLRGAEELIREGRVSVNGQRVLAPGTKADLTHDRVEVDGQPVSLAAAEAHTYLMLNKPVGVVSSARDPGGRPTVIDLVSVPDVARLYPVGRLDADSAGLLLLTDDGELTYRLTQARFRVEKEYHALVRGFVRDDVLDQLVRPGVELEDGRANAVRVAVLEADRRSGESWVRVVLHEGRKREVRRMLAAIGHPVLMLRRVRVGTLPLGELEPGEWRALSDAEVDGLRRSVGLNAEPQEVDVDAD